jgi:hypothetical protein
MILIIRGHIRNSFDTKILYYFVENIYSLYPDLNIYIHTWNIFANNISWRNILTNDNIVTEEVIYNYFDKLNNCIKHIIIDDDKNIELHGNLEGNINNGHMPIIGWKNYWYGKYKIINYIYNNVKCEDEMIINFRFDLFSNSNLIKKQLILNSIKNNDKTKFYKNNFIFNYERNGIDNIYFGNIHTMYKLINYFHHELDDIINNNTDISHHEVLVYRVNSNLFS